NNALKLRITERLAGLFEIALPLFCGLLGDEQHRAARCVAPERGALRPFQNLGVFQAEERTGPRAVAGSDTAPAPRRDDVAKINAQGGGCAQFLSKVTNHELRAIVVEALN